MIFFQKLNDARGLMLFNDRQDAGRQLAARLQNYKGVENVVIMGMARGGVAVAYEVAHALKLPLDVIVVRKVGAPQNEELALGAVTENGEGIFNEQLIGVLGVPNEYVKREVEKQKKLAQTRVDLYRKSLPPLEVKGKEVILVDDGIATGSSVIAAIRSLRAKQPQKIVLAVPVASPTAIEKISPLVDGVVCLSTPLFFEAVGAFYRHFDQTTDDDVIRLLNAHH